MEKLKDLLGNKHGEDVYYKSRGIDNNPLIEFREVKSIGEQTTFNQNTLEAKIICDTFLKLSESVFQKFTESNFASFKTITITVRFADFETKTTSKTFKDPITKTQKKKLSLEIFKLILPFLDSRSNPRRKPIRLIGVRLDKLVLWYRWNFI